MDRELVKELQEQYEDQLSSYWHKVLDIRGLIKTNIDNSPFRLKSIADRKRELERITSKIKAFRLLFEDFLDIYPIWYKDITDKHKIGLL